MLYAVCSLAFICLTTAAGLIRSVPHGDWFASEVLGGAFMTIVTTATFGDVRESSRAFQIDRGFERSWAVILIGLAIDLVAALGIVGVQAPSIFDVVLAGAVLLMTATLMFAPVDAVVSEDPWWRLVPFALSRSIAIGLRPAVFPRALIALAVGYLGAQTLDLALEQWLSAAHVPHALLWAEGIANALLLPPVQAFATIVYLDAIAPDRPRT